MKFNPDALSLVDVGGQSALLSKFYNSGSLGQWVFWRRGSNLASVHTKVCPFCTSRTNLNRSALRKEINQIRWIFKRHLDANYIFTVYHFPHVIILLLTSLNIVKQAIYMIHDQDAAKFPHYIWRIWILLKYKKMNDKCI